MYLGTFMPHHDKKYLSSQKINTITEGPASKYFLCKLTTQVARKVVDHYNREFASLGLTGRQLMALGTLAYSEDLTITDFAEQLMIRKSTAVTMVKRLEALGLVTKTAHPSDGRSNILEITDKTRELLPKIRKKAIELEDSLEAQIGVSALRRTVDDLAMLLKAKF